jgi:hypothetical protein
MPRKNGLLIPNRKFDPDHICFMCGGTYWCYEILGVRKDELGKPVSAIRRDKKCDCREAKAYHAQQAGG